MQRNSFNSLYAVDLACQALWRNGTDAMIAMGVNRSEMVALQVGFSQLGAYSEQGQCLPFLMIQLMDLLWVKAAEH